MSGSASYTVTDEDDLNAAIAAINADANSVQPQDYEYTINFAEGLTQPIVLDAPLTALDSSGGFLTINGNGATLSGGNLYAGLDFVSGSVEVSNLTIEDATAVGGNGAPGVLGGGGGGAGLGGGMSVGANAGVDLYDVNFLDNAATGGNGGGTGVGNAAGGAGSLPGSSATAAGSAGSFGDGGGGTTAAAAAGAGGFGGGGGGGGTGAAGGTGAGAGNATGGGGGFGGGADIFVASGGHINVSGGTIQGGSDNGGTDADGTVNGSSGGGLLLQGGGSLDLYGDGATPLIESDALVDSPDGAVSLYVGGGTVVLSNPNDTYSGGTLLQAGTLDVAVAGAIGPGNYGNIANIEFGNASTAVLQIEQAALTSGTFTPTIANFDSSEEIDIRGIGTATSAKAGANDTLVVTGGSETVTLNLNFYSVDEGQTFYTASDGAGGTVIVSETLSPNNAADAAVDGTQARSEYDVTGTGSKIGIISDSFNANGGARGEEVAGFLPSTVTVLGDNTSGSDEGRAMAELVHETAPGAQIYFDNVGNTLNSFAAAVTALANAGCNIIVDDVINDAEPFFQEGDVLDNAIESFVGSGGNYFTAAGNFGDAFYQAAFNPITVTLPGQSAPVTAMNFGNSNALQSFTIGNGGYASFIDLQWDQPFASIGAGGPGGDGSQNSLALYVFNSAGTLVASGTQNVVGSDPVQILYVGNLYPGNYQLAIVVNGGSAPDLFRYTFTEDSGVTINDPNAGAGTGNVFGHALLADVNTVGADDVTQTPSEGTSPPVAEPYSVYGPGELLFDDNGNALASPVIDNKVDFTAPDGSVTDVGSDFDPFYGTSAAAPVAAAVAALVLQADASLTSAQVSADLAQSAIPMGSAGDVGTGLIQATTAVMLAEEQVACYCRGTRILTVRGEIPVEQLQIGDLLATFTGTGSVLKPIRWLGHRRIDLRRNSDPENTHPIRFRAGALGEGCPHRDLLVSPGHRMRVGAVLITALELVNGATIVQESPDEAEYWHIELDGHEIILAEGTQAETFQDVGNRDAFENNAIVALNPVLDGDVPEPCLPYAGASAELRDRLIAQAETLGWIRAIDPTPCLDVDGERIEPIRHGPHWRFTLPAGCQTVRLCSRAGRPWDVDVKSGDRRRLGLKLHHLALGDACGIRTVALDSPHLSTGFNCVERDETGHTWRWTNGDAVLRLAELALRPTVTVVEIAFDQALPMWVAPVAAQTSGMKAA